MMSPCSRNFLLSLYIIIIMVFDYYSSYSLTYKCLVFRYSMAQMQVNAREQSTCKCKLSPSSKLDKILEHLKMLVQISTHKTFGLSTYLNSLHVLSFSTQVLVLEYLSTSASTHASPSTQLHLSGTVP